MKWPWVTRKRLERAEAEAQRFLRERVREAREEGRKAAREDHEAIWKLAGSIKDLSDDLRAADMPRLDAINLHGDDYYAALGLLRDGTDRFLGAGTGDPAGYARLALMGIKVEHVEGLPRGAVAIVPEPRP